MAPALVLAFALPIVALGDTCEQTSLMQRPQVKGYASLLEASYSSVGTPAEFEWTVFATNLTIADWAGIASLSDSFMEGSIPSLVQTRVVRQTPSQTILAMIKSLTVSTGFIEATVKSPGIIDGTSAAKFIIGIGSVVTPLVALIPGAGPFLAGGLGLVFSIMSAVLPSPSMSEQMAKFHDLIIKEVTGMISKAQVEASLNVAKAKLMAFTNLLSFAPTRLTPPRDNMTPDQIADMRLEYWRNVLDEMILTKPDLFGASVGCMNGSDPTDPPPEDCKKFYNSGVYVAQLTFAQMHMHVLTQVGELKMTADSRKSTLYEIRGTAQSYYKFLSMSLLNSAPDQSECFKKWGQKMVLCNKLCGFLGLDSQQCRDCKNKAAAFVAPCAEIMNEFNAYVKEQMPIVTVFDMLSKDIPNALNSTLALIAKGNNISNGI